VTKKKDLFDDSVMTFGEHLEALRFHLIRALLGLAVAVMITMLCGEVIIKIIRQPIDSALAGYRERVEDKVTDDVQGFDFFGTVWETLKAQFVVPSSAPKCSDRSLSHSPRTTCSNSCMNWTRKPIRCLQKR
jgi:Sec-independent protein secretion pathway component TatC